MYILIPLYIIVDGVVNRPLSNCCHLPPAAVMKISWLSRHMT